MAAQASNGSNGVNGAKKQRILRVGMVGCGEIAQVSQVGSRFKVFANERLSGRTHSHSECPLRLLPDLLPL